MSIVNMTFSLPKTTWVNKSLWTLDPSIHKLSYTEHISVILYILMHPHMLVEIELSNIREVQHPEPLVSQAAPNEYLRHAGKEVMLPWDAPKTWF